MKITRRDLLFAGALSLLARAAGSGQSTASPARTPQARFLDALKRNRLPLTMGDTPAGPGWDRLVSEARMARFTLIGEEHGVADKNLS